MTWCTWPESYMANTFSLWHTCPVSTCVHHVTLLICPSSVYLLPHYFDSLILNESFKSYPYGLHETTVLSDKAFQVLLSPVPMWVSFTLFSNATISREQIDSIWFRHCLSLLCQLCVLHCFYRHAFWVSRNEVWHMGDNAVSSILSTPLWNYTCISSSVSLPQSNHSRCIHDLPIPPLFLVCLIYSKSLAL